MLEEKGLYVFPEKMEVNKSDSKYKKNQIIKQSVEPGKLLEEGDSITLTIPDIVVTYPDFNLEGYSRASIESFCSDKCQEQYQLKQQQVAKQRKILYGVVILFIIVWAVMVFKPF